VFGGAVVSGLVGALTGLGGGVVLTPLLMLAFGVDFRYAAGASLVCVIATSAGAGVAYAREGLTNYRVGLVLLVAACAGALAGAVAAGHTGTRALTVIFAVILAGSALTSLRKRRAAPAELPPDPLATRLGLDAAAPTPAGPVPYHVRHVPAGFALMGVSGAISGMLGLGSGALKVLAMDEVLKLPFKVSTTTSNFMIGVAATASAGVYLGRGWIDPMLTAPVVLGVPLGAALGARILQRLEVPTLRLIFVIVLLVVAVQMLWKGLA
jgi:uncharacterized membrane protein YfcA